MKLKRRKHFEDTLKLRMTGNDPAHATRYTFSLVLQSISQLIIRAPKPLNFLPEIYLILRELRLLKAKAEEKTRDVVVRENIGISKL